MVANVLGVMGNLSKRVGWRVRRKVPILMVCGALLGSGSVWIIDVSNITLIDGDTHLTNGMFQVPANIAFHVDMYTILATIWLLTLFNWRK